MFTFWIQKHSVAPSSHRHFPLPLPSDLAILIRTHIFSSPFLVLETQNLEPSRTKKTRSGDSKQNNNVKYVRFAGRFDGHGGAPVIPRASPDGGGPWLSPKPLYAAIGQALTFL